MGVTLGVQEMGTLSLVWKFRSDGHARLVAIEILLVG